MKRVFWALIFTAGLGFGETLQVLVLEASERYAKAVYERATSGNRDDLEEAIIKLQQLTTEQGVQQWLSLDIPREDPGKRIVTEEMSFQPTLHKNKRTPLGHEHTWSRTGEGVVSRSLVLNTHLDKGRLLRLRSNFYHPIDGKWSLSGALTGAKGTIFIFERLVGKELLDDPPSWMLGVLHEKKPRFGNSSPVEKLLAPPLGRAGLVRIPPKNQSSKATVFLDLATDTDYLQSYSVNQVGFGAVPAREKQERRPKIPTLGWVEVKRLVSIGVNSTVTHEGAFTLPMESKSGEGNFEVVRRDNVRSGSTTRSTASKEKPEYYLSCQIIARK